MSTVVSIDPAQRTLLTIFDCDGVLVDSESVCISSELEFFGARGVEFERANYIRSFMGLAQDEWEQKLRAAVIEKLGNEPEIDFLKQLDDFVIERLKDHLVPVDGAFKAIESLPMARCVASSAAPDSLKWKLTDTGLIELFQPNVFSADYVQNGKPAPDLFLFAAQRMGIHPSKCVVIEDSSNGVIAGKRAGMVVIGLTAAGHCPVDHADTLLRDGADMVAASYDDLVRQINGL